METEGIVLSLCDLTTNMVQPWLEAGYECWCVDMQHPSGIARNGNLVTVGCDLLHWLPPRRNYRIAFGFTPCTNVAVSGARWFRDKGLAGLAEAIRLLERVRDICEWCECPWLIENPVSTLSTYWRKPGTERQLYEADLPLDGGGLCDAGASAYCCYGREPDAPTPAE